MPTSFASDLYQSVLQAAATAANRNGASPVHAADGNAALVVRIEVTINHYAAPSPPRSQHAVRALSEPSEVAA